MVGQPVLTSITKPYLHTLTGWCSRSCPTVTSCPRAQRNTREVPPPVLCLNKEKSARYYPKERRKKRLSFIAGDSVRARGTDLWSALEERSLVEFMVKKGFVKDWPHTKNIDFLEGAAKFIEQHGFAKRTSKCCNLSKSRYACQINYILSPLIKVVLAVLK